MAKDMNFSSQLSNGQKGMLLDDGQFVAWDVDSNFAPEHNEILEEYFPYSLIVAKSSFLDGIIDVWANADATLCGPIVKSMVHNIDVHPTDKIRMIIDAAPPWEGTLKEFKQMCNTFPAPDPEDYENGEEDSEYQDDVEDWIEEIEEKTTASKLLRSHLVPREGEWKESKGGEFSAYNPRRKRNKA